jgi:hypothetical protein
MKVRFTSSNTVIDPDYLEGWVIDEDYFVSIEGRQLGKFFVRSSGIVVASIHIETHGQRMSTYAKMCFDFYGSAQENIDAAVQWFISIHRALFEYSPMDTPLTSYEFSMIIR